jgi:hypothetical protein
VPVEFEVAVNLIVAERLGIALSRSVIEKADHIYRKEKE